MDDTTIRTQIRLPRALYDHLRAAASSAGRSLNGEMVTRLAQTTDLPAKLLAKLSPEELVLVHVIQSQSALARAQIQLAAAENAQIAASPRAVSRVTRLMRAVDDQASAGSADE